MSQPTVDSAYTPQWAEGQVTRGGHIRDWTLNNEDASIMKIGYTVIGGTDPRRQAQKPVAVFDFDDFAGIIIQALGIREKTLITGAIEIENGRSFTVLKEGYMAVKLTDTILPREDVYFVHTGGGASALWTYRGDADTDKASKIPAVCEQGGVDGDIVEIYVNFAMQIGVS